MGELRIFVVSIAALIIIIIGGCIIKKKQKKKKWFISRILMAGFFVATLIWCFGEWILAGEQNAAHVIKDFFLAIQCALQIFTMDFDYEFFENLTKSNNGIVSYINAVYTSVLMVVAPFLTASVILSFFNETTAFIKLFFSWRKKIYVFSELNREALSIARSCKEKAEEERRKILIIFTDVDKERVEPLTEMIEEAHSLDAVCVKKDILSLNYFSILNKGVCEFFIIGKNENENMKHTQELINKYKDNEMVKVYLFSEDKIEKMLVNAMITPDMKMTVRCINIKQNTIYDYLYKDSRDKNIMFQYAIPQKEGEAKLLSIAVGGNNAYARELIKGLLWYGQMLDYELHLHIFDENGSIEDELRSECTELMKMNGEQSEGEESYHMHFYNYIPGTYDYYKTLRILEPLSSLYLMYEDEKKNIKIGIESDRVLKRENESNITNIVCLICNGDKKEFIQKDRLKDYKNNVYNLNYIYQQWDYNSIYNNELETAALEEHLKWDMKPKFNQKIAEMTVEEIERIRKTKTADFYKYDYFYRSSIARVIRVRLRYQMNVPGARKPLKDRTLEERKIIREIEHRGWNAYMRTEGYCYGADRNEMLKLHQDLIPFSQLKPEEQEKDDD